MVLKIVGLLLVLAVSQVFATSVLHLRSLEILDSRQATCDICTTVSKAIAVCGTNVVCFCTPAIAGDIQKCINCDIAANPSPDAITTAQSIITSFETICRGVAGVSTVTLPPTTGGGMTSATTPPTIKNTVVPSSTTPLTTSTTSQGTGSSDVPGGIVKGNSASQYKNHMVLVAIGVMVGAAVI